MNRVYTNCNHFSLDDVRLLQVVCTAIAVILHLSLLTVFSLMLAIGIDYMLIIVKPLYTKHLGNQYILASFGM